MVDAQIVGVEELGQVVQDAGVRVPEFVERLGTIRFDAYLEKNSTNFSCSCYERRIAVIARSGGDVLKLYEYLQARYGAQYTVQNITSQRRNDITILSAIGSNLAKLFPDPAAANPGTSAQSAVSVPDWPEFERRIRDENIRLNSLQRGGNRYNQNGPTVNKDGNRTRTRTVWRG